MLNPDPITTLIHREDCFPTLPTVEFTEDDWTTVYTGFVSETSVYFYYVNSITYGNFWIPKQNVRLK